MDNRNELLNVLDLLARDINDMRDKVNRERRISEVEVMAIRNAFNECKNSIEARNKEFVIFQSYIRDRLEALENRVYDQYKP